MTTTTTIPCTAKHVQHLISVLESENVGCGAEVQIKLTADPLIGIPYAPTSTEYISSPDGDSLVINIGDAEFGFDVNDIEFAYHISDIQIAVVAMHEHYAVWFNSGVLTKEGIAWARNYDTDFEDKVIHMEVASDDFEDAFQFLTNLIREGRVIKSVKVLGDGNQVLTVGYVDKAQS